MVGFHVVGPNAGEITQGFSIALQMKATKENFDDLVGIHPTCAEVSHYYLYYCYYLFIIIIY